MSLMNRPVSIHHLALALALAGILPAGAHAAVLYDQIVVRDANGAVLASVTATPAQIAADPDALYYVPGIAVDPNEYGNYGIIVDDNGDPYELFGITTGGPDSLNLAFGLQGVASQAFLQNPVADSGAPIDLTAHLDPGLQLAGDTASFVVSNPAAAVPEPLSWAMMVVGFAAIGGVTRRCARFRKSVASGR